MPYPQIGDKAISIRKRGALAAGEQKGHGDKENFYFLPWSLGAFCPLPSALLSRLDHPDKKVIGSTKGFSPNQ
jgi:hypothetical protein